MTRERAIVAMEQALDQYFISGLVNNTSFLRSVFRNEQVQAEWAGGFQHYAIKTLCDFSMHEWI